MPATQIYKTPGVYVAELTAFPPSVVGVATAIPVFIGYTERATIDGKPVLNKPVRIDSLAAFEEVFGQGYRAIYNLEEVKNPKGDNYDFRVLKPDSVPTWVYYRLTATGSSLPPLLSLLNPPSGGDGEDAALARTTLIAEDPAPDQPRFNLYNSMRLFYANGGATCFVVSVGTYDKATLGVDKQALLDGLSAAGEQVGPTMTVIPDAVLLPPNETTAPWVSSDFAEVARAMITQAADLQDRIAILDVYGTQYANSSDHPAATLDVVIEQFRTDVGGDGLSYGAAYFPFLNTTVMPLSDVTYQNIDNTGGALQTILTWENETLYGGTPREAAVQAYIDAIPWDPEVVKLNQNLLAALPILKTIESQVVAMNDVLPSSGAMAGVYTRVDARSGVWNAPANVTLASVAKPTLRVDNAQQEDLNVPVDGKAVDVIRSFPGRGSVVWGARTLLGNSPDFRYVQVRRTLIYIEQSIKSALDPFVFAPNTPQTWATVTSMVSGFLTTLWSQGGLMGATAKDAFTVACGVGSTMTGTDVLDGYMIVQVTISLVRPAEFIEITFKQTMEGVG